MSRLVMVSLIADDPSVGTGLLAAATRLGATSTPFVLHSPLCDTLDEGQD
jgi:hypothetical protein